jgi:hypothetical protein
MSPILKIPFGLGLDRETGVMTTSPSSMEDLRNVFLHEDKILMRRGFLERLTLTDGSGNPMTHTLAGQALRQRREAIVVGYNDVLGEVHVFAVDQSALTQTHLGEWTSGRYDDGVTPPYGNEIFPLAVGSPPPKISMTEVGGRVFMAHDIADVALRARTVFVSTQTHGDPLSAPDDTIFFLPDESAQYVFPEEDDYTANPTPLYDLVTDFANSDGLPDEPIHFRGVTRHLDYLVGWGWGSYDGVTGLADRVEYVRFSKPAEPTVFTQMDYALVGDRGDPVVSCMPVGPSRGGSLLCFKETETYHIIGSSPATFGTFLLDQLHGMSASRAAVNVSGAVFFWSHEGPRFFDGSGPSQSLDIPLELIFPEPSSLIPEGPLDDAFAAYLPTYRVVLWVFGQRVYALTIRVGGNWKWSYWELGFPARSAWYMPPTGFGLLSAPTGFPSSPVASSIDDTTADITWDNNAQTGNETVEIWIKPDSGPWALNRSVAVNLAATQVAGVTGLSAGEGQTVAVRYRRCPFYTAGYGGIDPLTWPASSRSTFSTTLTSVPTISSTLWSRTSASTEQIAVGVTPAVPGTDVEIHRDAVLIHTEIAPAGAFTFNDTGVVGEATEVYKVRHIAPIGSGPFSGDTNQWAGPSPPITGPNLTWDSPTTDDMDITWANGDGSIGIEIRDNYTGSAWSTYPQRVVITLSAGAVGHTESYAPPPPSGTAEIGVRHKQTLFGIDDYSEDRTDTETIP